MGVLIITWYISLIILVIYYQVIFLPRRKKRAIQDETSRDGVSIIIAVKNSSAVLGKNLRAIVQQDYPAFEVIVVNDHSAQAESEKLEVLKNQFPQVTLLHSNRSPGKKQALTQGIENAQYPFILCTDADCKPVSRDWIASMMHAKGSSDIVLGYSPYEEQPGFLNQLIRFDTILTAMQYMSWAMLNRPYMGVGRNVLFSKEVFLQLNPYQDNIQVPYGDDDALVQAARGKYSMDVSLHPDSFVFSQPKTTWKDWFRQKHRHLSAGLSYSRSTWWQTGGFAIALVMHWLGVLVLLMVPVNPLWIPACLLGWGLRWIIYGSWAKQLRDSNTTLYFPLLEFAYAVYLAYTGLLTLLSKRSTWN